jgi:hypothetical protein
MTVTRTRILLGTLGFGAVIGCLLAPPAAHADAGQDAQFLQLIASHGMTFQSADVALREGHAVCTTLAAGYNDAAVVDAVEQVMPLTYDEALDVVAASMVSFCPEYVPSHRIASVA